MGFWTWGLMLPKNAANFSLFLMSVFFSQDCLFPFCFIFFPFNIFLTIYWALHTGRAIWQLHLHLILFGWYSIDIAGTYWRIWQKLNKLLKITETVSSFNVIRNLETTNAAWKFHQFAIFPYLSQFGQPLIGLCNYMMWYCFEERAKIAFHPPIH